MRKILKSFPGITAVKNVSVSVYPGEILGLVGENGAGKSTLMNVLGGIVQLDSGSIMIQGAKVDMKNPLDSQSHGIGYIHQELELFPTMSIAENIFMNDFASERLSYTIPHAELFEKSNKLIQQLGLVVSSKLPVASLSYAEKTIVEIAKALSKDAKIIIFDEPTSSLTDREKDNLFGIIKSLKDQNKAIIFISHNLEEVLAISDRIVVMRDGEKVIEIARTEFDRDVVIASMIGKEIQNLYPKAECEIGKTVFEVQDLGVLGKLSNIFFKLRRGEIFGIAGLLGSGKTDLARAIFGLVEIESGRFFIEGKEIKIRNPQEAKEHGIGFVTNDRHNEGLVLSMNVKDNIALTVLDKMLRGFLKIVDTEAEHRLVNDSIKLLSIKTSGPEQVVDNLSGGNQQKVVLAKWIETNPRIFILDEPTRGIDVGTKAEVHRIMGTLVKKGVSIILISSEIEELTGLADRIAVMFEGRIKKILSRSEFDKETIMKYASVGE